MLTDVARVREAELFSNQYQMAARMDWEVLSRLERAQRAVVLARARLGLVNLKIAG